MSDILNEGGGAGVGANKDIGRNEPCPCGSGKKYKRCCGVAAAPKLGPPRAAGPDFGAGAGGGPGPGFGAPGGFSPDQMDPAAMMQIAQMLQRLPKGQMQKLQSLMQRAMAGKDVAREAEEFEKTLPVDLQNTLHAMKLPGLGGGALGGAGESALPALTDDSAGGAEMTAEQARKLVEEAARSGKISKEEAAALLQASSGDASPTDEIASRESDGADVSAGGPTPPATPGETPGKKGISKLFGWGKK